MVTVHVDFDIKDLSASIIAFLKKTAAIRDPKVDEWELDLADCPYLGPDGTAVIVAEFLAARKAGKKCRVQLPAENSPLNAFVAFSGLKHLLTDSPIENHPGSLTIPIQIRTASAFDDPDPIIQLIRRHAAISDEAEEYLAHLY